MRHTLRANVTLPPTRYADAQRKATYVNEVLTSLSAIPGLDSVAAARLTPFTDNVSIGASLIFPDTGQKTAAYFKWNAVTPAFFKAMGIPMLLGRTFAPADHGDKVAVVNETFVKRYLGRRRPIGTSMLRAEVGPIPYRIVGVVAGTKTVTIGEDPQPQLYEPLDQVPSDRLRIQFVAHSTIPPALQVEAVRAALHRIDPAAAAEVETMISSMGLAFLPSQVGALLLGSIGVLGLLLAAIGLYGVMDYSVVRRTREIGIRISVGATRSNVSRMVLFECARLIVTGSAIGLSIALFLTRPLAIFLVPGLHSVDPITFLAVILVTFLTGMFAAWAPMRRATAVDPNIALRYE